MESHLRSVCKAVSWRFFAALITTSLAWALTGQARIAAYLGLADAVLKIGVYYAHERVWTRIKFGRLQPLNYEI